METNHLDIRENVPLGPMTTLGIGGPARYFVEAASEEEVFRSFEFARSRRLEILVLGGGSNVLVADRGFDGLAIKVAIRGIEHGGRDGEILTAAAGEDWDAFVEYCVGRGLAGVECLSGIPGLVGGTPVQNVGAYGQAVSETIDAVRCFDRAASRTVVLRNEECGFDYRRSIFNTAERDRYVVLAVTFRMQKHGEPKIAYKDLKEHFAGRRPTLRETRDAVLSIRRAKSMVIDAGDPNSRSAGSFFKNPVIGCGHFESIAAEFPGVPSFPDRDGRVKVPAAWLIENSGFGKGYRAGNAGISEKHSLAIVNLGGATAAEVVALKDRITAAVREKFGIVLVPEPVFVGF